MSERRFLAVLGVFAMFLSVPALAGQGFMFARGSMSSPGFSAGDLGLMEVDPYEGLVDPGSGSVLESYTDFAMPSKGLAAVQWHHTRTFDHRTSGPGDTAQGQKWFHPYLMSLTLSGSPNADADVYWRADAHHRYLFSNTGSYAFDPNDATFAVLSHEHTGDPADTYRLELLDGTLLIFNDFDYTNSNERGKLRYIRDVYGNDLTVTFQGSNTGRIDYITDPSGHYFRYTYLTSGDNDTKLDYIRVFKSSGTTDADCIARIEFTYRDNTGTPDSNDTGTGITGDLIKVVVKTHQTGETSSTFSISSTQHYRYYKSGDTYGTDHQLKYILRPEHFQRADDDAGFGDPLTATDGNVDDYATYQFQYELTNNRCSQQIIGIGGGGGGGCGGCGGGSDDGTYDFTYTSQASSNRNEWALRAKVERKVSATVMWTKYIDCNAWGELFQWVLLSDDGDHSKPLWGRRYDRDSDSGQVTTMTTESAISDYTAASHALTYVSTGVVYDYTYDGSSYGMATMRIRQQSQSTGDAKYLRRNTYTAAPSGVTYWGTHYFLTAVDEYPTETTTAADGSRLTTSYEYVCHPDSGNLDGDGSSTEQTIRPMVIKTTLPTVTTGQYGPNSAATRYVYFNTAGQQNWTKDEEGAAHYTAFNALTGQQTYSVRDVYTGTSEGAILPAGITAPETDGGVDIWADWTGAAPKDLGASPTYDFQTTGSSSDYVKRENKMLPDLQGRVRKSTDAAGIISYMAYLDREQRSYGAWNASTDKPGVPAVRILTDREGRTKESIQVDPTSPTFSDPPDGSESLSTQTSWVSWSKTSYDSALRPSTRQVYHTIPSSGSGSAVTNYYETTYTYADDTTNKVETVQVRDPEAGYTKTTKNAHHQVIKTEQTATESMGSPTTWKTVSETYYDQSTPGSGASKGGPGNVTQVKSYYADASSNSTSFTYDWRNRQVFNSPPAGPKSLNKYDNMGRIVATGTFSNGTSLSVSDDPTTSSFTGRLALSETSYNNRGQVYESKQWEIIESDGSKDSSLITKMYYSRRGESVATWGPGSGPSVTKYNGAGEVIQSQSCVDLGSTIYSGGFDYSSDNKVVEMTTNVLDSGGRTIEVYHYAMTAGSTSYIDPATVAVSTSTAVPTVMRYYYDSAGRMTQTTNFGSTAGGGLTGPFNASKSAPSSYNSGSPESRSDTQLVTTSTYSSSGRLASTADVDNKQTSYEYDARGLKTATVEDSGGLARRTEQQYNGNGDLTKLIARDVAEYGYSGGDALEDQVTQYVYGHGINSHWVTEVRYPGSDGQASSSSADKVANTYNNDGTLATKTDQNGSVHTYNYDALRRQTHDLITTVGSGVDSAVVQIVTTFDSSGRVQKITQRDSGTADAGSIVNEVKFTYNGYSQLTKDEQEHSGAVSGSVNVQYAYSESAGSNHSRLTTMTYPNSRAFLAQYTHSASSTKQDEIADAFSQIRAWGNGSAYLYSETNQAGNSLVTGVKAAGGATSLGNDSYLNYDTGSADQYAGKDFAGRIIGQKVVDVAAGTTTRSDYQYSAQRDGSPSFAQPQEVTMRGRSNLYTYDGLHRLSQSDMGQLNSGRTDITDEWSDPQQLIYTMDILGNITTLNRKNSGTNGNETRAYNATNELTSRTVEGEAERFWVNDPFTDNDTTQYSVANLNTGGSDGTWAAGSSKLTCSATCTPTSHTGLPDGPSADGSLILIDNAAYQDIEIKVTGTMDSSCENLGIVFGYQDRLNFFVKVYSKLSSTIKVYQVSAGAWTSLGSVGTLISAGSPVSMSVEVHAGSAGGYSATVPAGQVGLWCGGATGDFDNFTVQDIAGPFEADGYYFSNSGLVTTDGSNNNVMQWTGSFTGDKMIVRRGFRGDKYNATFKFVWNANINPGWVVHWISPSDYVFVAISNSDKKARLYKCVDGYRTTLATASSAYTLSNGTTYNAKVTVDDDPGNSALQRFRFQVDTNANGFGDDTYFDSTAVDDDASVSIGYAGLAILGVSTAATHQFDDVVISDNSSNVQVSDDFNTNVITLSYDNNGNLSDDGIFKFVYDAWNRLVTAKRSHGSNATIGAYAYDGATRRTKKVVTNQGAELVANDGGNQTQHFYYQHWRIAETRNGSNQTTFLYGWGNRYADEIEFIEKNGDPTTGNDSTPDVTGGGEGAESPADKRYYAVQDRNWNVMALTEYVVGGGGSNGRVAERYSYTPYGESAVLKGDSGSGETAKLRNASALGVSLGHQGLYLDAEIGAYQNRYRMMLPNLNRFGRRDPRSGAATYAALESNPVRFTDVLGLSSNEGHGKDDCDARYTPCDSAYWDCLAGRPTRKFQGPSPQPTPSPTPNRPDSPDSPRPNPCDLVEWPSGAHVSATICDGKGGAVICVRGGYRQPTHNNPPDCSKFKAPVQRCACEGEKSAKKMLDQICPQSCQGVPAGRGPDMSKCDDPSGMFQKCGRWYLEHRVGLTVAQCGHDGYERCMQQYNDPQQCSEWKSVEESGVSQQERFEAYIGKHRECWTWDWDNPDELQGTYKK